MVLNTYRWMGHSKSDAQVYRSKEEVNEWKEKCPIKRFKGYLLKEDVAAKEELDALDKKGEEDIRKAVEFAEHSSELPIEKIMEDVYA